MHTGEGFRRTGSGLLVPGTPKTAADIEAEAREREVWTTDEFKILERATKLLMSRDIQIFFRCREAMCQREPMQRIRNPDGGLTLRCSHKDRVFPRHL